jgi:hypothetical protein
MKVTHRNSESYGLRPQIRCHAPVVGDELNLCAAKDESTTRKQTDWRSFQVLSR